jgi:hypothetical protein
MCSRRLASAVLVATVLTCLVAMPTSAREPIAPPTRPLAERPLTDAERAASERKVAAALARMERIAASGADLRPLACVTPQSSTTSGSSGPVTASCSPPQGFLSVEARDQLFNHYCGPAVGQVIANYSWAVASGNNKYTQGRIAGWMGTDVYGQTDAPRLEDGLEAATAGAPRRPSGWDWVVTDVRDLDADGTTGDELHAFVRSNISVSRMGLAVPVKPHDRLSQVNLPSWTKPVASVGHWIGVYGWLGLWNGGDTARTYYTDSSKDEGGATGKFWLPTRHLAILVAEHTRRIVW